MPRWVVRETIQTKSRPGYRETVTLRTEQQKEDPTAEEKQSKRSRVQANMTKQIDEWKKAQYQIRIWLEQRRNTWQNSTLTE